MIDMPERLEMIRYLNMVLDEERKGQPVRLAQAEVAVGAEGIVVLFRRPRHAKVLLPTTWLNGRSNSIGMAMTLAGFKLCELLRNLDEIPEDLPPLPAEVKPAKEPSREDRDRGLEFALRPSCPMPGQTARDVVATADAFARYLAGERPASLTE